MGAPGKANPAGRGGRNAQGWATWYWGACSAFGGQVLTSPAPGRDKVNLPQSLTGGDLTLEYRNPLNPSAQLGPLDLVGYGRGLDLV